MPILSQGVSDAKAKGGPGSMLAAMTWAYRQNDTFGELWHLPLADAGGATAASGSIALAGTATAAGSISVYIAGQLVVVPVAIGTTAAQAATALQAQIALQTDLPVTAAVTTPTVTVTAKNAGLAGNDIDIPHEFPWVGRRPVHPRGSDAYHHGNVRRRHQPHPDDRARNLNNEPFDFIISPYTDATSIAALTAFLNDTTGRWSWQVQVYGGVFMAYRGSAGALTTFGQALNDQHTSCIGFFDSPSPVWNWAAALAGASANSLRADPGVPLQTLKVYGVLAPPLQSRFSLSTRNALLFDGISTYTVDATGAVALENVITTYQRNGQGQPDNSYLEIETMFLLAFVLRSLASVVTSKYARVKLAADGVRFGTGANVVTPSTIRADIIAQYQELEAGGYVQNSQAFAQALIVQQNSTTPNRVDVVWPGTLIDQLRIFAVLAQFRLN